MASKKKNILKTHSCDNNQNHFCYTFTKYEILKYRKNITGKVREMYAKYFNIKFPEWAESWALHIICSACNLMLYKCEKGGNNASLKFIVPVIWEKLQNESDCYLCMDDEKNRGFST